MAEREQSHRHRVERKLAGNFSRGQIFGFLLGMVGLVGGIWLITEGYGGGGIAAMISSVGVLAGALIYSSRKKE